MKSQETDQQGFAFLVLLAIILVAVTTALVSVLPINQHRTEMVKANAVLLDNVQQSLLGYALNHATPGTLPCPDTNGDGLENPMGTGCNSQLGLVPYRTLNIQRPVDASGAPVWFAVELNYVAGAGLRNPSRPTTLTLDGADMAAVIIAPGAALNNQSRTGLNSADFLEGLNADADLTDYGQQVDDTQNDQLVGMPNGFFWSLVEQRVMGEASSLLATYRTACGEYPFAADFGGPYSSVSDQQTGSIPFDAALPFDWGAACAFGNAPVPTAWLSTHWRDELLYRMCLAAEGNCLTVNNAPTNPAAAVVGAPGVALAGQVRPGTGTSAYFEGNNSSAPDNTFTHSRIIDHSATFNDSIISFAP